MPPSAMHQPLSPKASELIVRGIWAHLFIMIRSIILRKDTKILPNHQEKTQKSVVTCYYTHKQPLDTANYSLLYVLWYRESIERV